MIPYLISSSRIEGEFVYLGLEGVESLEETRDLIGKEFLIRSGELIQPGQDAYYPFQIIGADVFSEENKFIGKLSEIYVNQNQFFYEIKIGKKEYLVPAIKKFIKKIDLVEKKIIIHVVEGMFE